MAIIDGNTSLRSSSPVGTSRLAAKKKIAIISICAATSLHVDIALADNVNGKWCTEDGRQFQISYEIVKLSEGGDVYGDYDRYHYVFRLPPNVKLGGATVDLVLASRDVAYARYLSESGLEMFSEPEKWTRCVLGVS